MTRRPLNHFFESAAYSLSEQQAADIIASVRQTAERQRISLMFVILPFNTDSKQAELLSKVIRQQSLALIDLNQIAWEKGGEKFVSKLLRWRDPCHLNKAGNRWVAENLLALHEF